MEGRGETCIGNLGVVSVRVFQFQQLTVAVPTSSAIFCAGAQGFGVVLIMVMYSVHAYF